MTKQMMMLCEAKLVVEKQGDQEPTGKIEARVTTWGPREGADGRRFFYKPEGFMDWAKEFSAQGRPLPMFVNHAADAIPVGEWTSFEFDDQGMTAEGRLYLNTTQGSDLYQVMNESPAMFGGVSVGAYADEYSWVKEDGSLYKIDNDDDDEDEGYFQITKGGLREVSVVMYPNNPKAEVSKLEFFRADGTADLKVLEKALREAGLSKKDAVAAASIFKRVMEQREVAPEQLENAPTQRDADADATKEILLALEQRELVKLLSKRIK
jgi:HK97 family phage prohead protease